MNTTLINGKQLSERRLNALANEIRSLDRKPGLAIILIGDNPESALYVALKDKAARSIGMQVHIYRFPTQTPEHEIIDAISFLNSDDDIDGIIVQLPLPSSISTDAIMSAVDPDKDADGFLERNRTLLLAGAPYVEPVLGRVILEIIDSVAIDLTGKSIIILSGNPIFLEPISYMLGSRGAHVHVTLPTDPHFHEQVKESDLIISALGEPGVIHRHDIKENAALIDIGITKRGGKIFGDVDPDVDGKALWRTPVPGGVGPLTVAMLLDNVVRLYKKSTA